jgi:CheY-like chemotaxis protein
MLEFQFKIKSDKATNGNEAVRKVMDRRAPCYCGKSHPQYEIIFMDCNMPIMDGFEATEEIRKFDFIDQDNLSIVALTANTNDSYKQRC